ncbi:MAG: pseudouridine synthase [Bacillota bacterium]
MERLQKVMAKAGVDSRRKCEKIIKEGRVKVNGKVVTELGTKVNPQQDKIVVDGQEIEKERLVYILLNKPAGFITTVDDPKGRRTVLDLINVKQRVYPVGRLDLDTEGLLLLTNDGDVSYALTHPSHQVTKKYIATVEGVPNQNKLKSLERGIKLNDGWTAPAETERIMDFNKKSIISIKIHEGKKNQVKRMFKAVGNPVTELKRIKVGPLTLDDSLKVGQYRHLKSEEVKKLKKIAQKVQAEENN